MSQGKTPWKDPPEVGLKGSEGSFEVKKMLWKDPSDPCKPTSGGSFQGVFPWDIIDGVGCTLLMELNPMFGASSSNVTDKDKAPFL